jgi:hypothetical protein
MRAGLLAILLLFCVALLAPAQNPTFHAQSNVVLVPALVRDANGDVVYGLKEKDFIIEDNGVEQKVLLSEQAESEPWASYEFARLRRLNSMLDPLLAQGENQVAAETFDSVFDLKQSFTSDAGKIHDALGRLSSGDGGAAILDAVAYSTKLLSNAGEDSKRVLLLVSETRDHGSRMATLDDIAASLGSNNIAVYSLAFSPSTSNVLDTMRGNNKEEMHSSPDLLAPILMAKDAMRKNTPKALAELTGGEYETFHTEVGFEDQMLNFENHLRSRYLLSFQPVDPRPGLHRIQVRIKTVQGVIVLARSSYWAEGPAEAGRK